MMAWWRRLREKRVRDEDLREEIEFHIESRAHLNQTAGVPESEALEAARRQFGNTTLIREEARSMHINTFLESCGQDLRYAARGFARNPLFTITAVLAAALGIGATTAVFSVVDRILFRSLPYPHDDRLVSIGEMAPLDSNEFLLPDAYFDWRKYQTPFESMTSFTAGIADCDLTETNPVRLGCARVEANFLPVLGLEPILGRNFTADEDRPNSGERVALLSFGLWQSRFGRDPGIVGRTISIDSQPMRIVGVLPASFEMPTLGAPDLLVPQALNAATERSSRPLRVFARLKPGVSVEQAVAAMRPLFEQTLHYVPAAFRKEVHLRIRSLRDRQVQDAKLASWVLLCAVAAVLLIACANIANLLLARSTARQRELAVRAALGGGRARLIRQALTETLLLGVAGGVAGCFLAWIFLRILTRIAPDGIPRLEQATLDGRVLLFALAGSLVSGLLAGLAPAFQNPRPEALAGWRSTTVPRMVLREWLVAAQIAISLVLLAGAGMFLRSLWKLESVPIGMDAEHVVTAEFTLGKRYAEGPRQIQFFEDLEARLRQLPGATSFAVSDSLPPSGGARGRLFASIRVEGQPPFPNGTGGMVLWRYVTPGYFATLKIPIVRGRGFEERDRAPAENSVVLSESLARLLFPRGDALGQRLNIGVSLTVIGIARNVRNAGLARDADPEYYVLRKHVPDEIFRSQMPLGGWRQAKIAIRTGLDEGATARWLTREFAEIDPSLPVTISSLGQRVGKLAERPRFNAFLLALFAALGVLLAAVGLYGVMAFLVGQRTQEIGVRMALGATPGAIAKLVLGRALGWTAAGAFLGAVGSLFAARAVRSMLFQAEAQDPWALGTALAAILLIAWAAAWVPSRRAARIDPMSALRHE